MKLRTEMVDHLQEPYAIGGIEKWTGGEEAGNGRSRLCQGAPQALPDRVKPGLVTVL